MAIRIEPNFIYLKNPKSLKVFFFYTFTRNGFLQRNEIFAGSFKENPVIRLLKRKIRVETENDCIAFIFGEILWENWKPRKNGIAGRIDEDNRAKSL